MPMMPPFIDVIYDAPRRSAAPLFLLAATGVDTRAAPR